MLPDWDGVTKKIKESINNIHAWDSLVVNKRKPHTYRMFIYDGDVRICLHRFDHCEEKDAFFHPHPWESRMWILSGSYFMKVGCTQSAEDKDPQYLMSTILSKGSEYHSNNTNFWHAVIPLTTCYSVMVNGPPWGDKAHNSAPTTKGKDLDKMSDIEKLDHLAIFRKFI